MLNNFHIVALIKTRNQLELLYIPLHQGLQSILSDMWYQQYMAFITGINEVTFDAGYAPEEDDRFYLPAYNLPDGMNNESSLSVQALRAINDNGDSIEVIKAIVGYGRDTNGDELVLFQSFNRSHVIRPGRFLLLDNNTYISSDRPGLTLGNKLAAVYMPGIRKLLFQNFRLTNMFLPLADFYEEASEQDIRDILNHEALAPKDVDALAVDAPQWFRKRFAMLRDSNILNEYSAGDIAERSVRYDVDIRIDRGRIVFPGNKAEARRVLQFLNEELFRGAITETLYETNSKRSAE